MERVQSNPENRSCKDIVHEAAALVLSAARIRALLKTTCVRELLCVIPKASVLQLAKVMVDWSGSSVAITDEENNKKVIGILTERHIVKSISKGAFQITEPFLLVPL